MASEIDVLREHYDRYRAVTLEHLQRLSDEQLVWRPRPDAFNCAQHFVHLLQTENFYMRGLFGQDWKPERLRLPKALPNKPDLQGQFAAVRSSTARQRPTTVGSADSNALVDCSTTGVQRDPLVHRFGASAGTERGKSKKGATA
jgi:hypothetical protein